MLWRLSLAALLFATSLGAFAQAQIFGPAVYVAQSAGTSTIAFVGQQSYAASSTCASGGTTIGSYTIGADSNGLLIIAFTGDYQAAAGGTGFDDITSVKYGATSASLAVKRVSTSGATTNGPRYIYLYYVLLGNTSSSASNVVISCTNSHYLGVSVAEYQNVSQGAPNATGTGLLDSGATSSTASVAVTPTVANSWVIGALSGYSGGSAPTAGSGTTLRSSETTNHTEALFDSNAAEPSGSAYTLNFNSPSTFAGWAAAAAAFNP